MNSVLRVQCYGYCPIAHDIGCQSVMIQGWLLGTVDQFWHFHGVVCVRHWLVESE